jgi:hypothetical protein
MSKLRATVHAFQPDADIDFVVEKAPTGDAVSFGIRRSKDGMEDETTMDLAPDVARRLARAILAAVDAAP